MSRSVSPHRERTFGYTVGTVLVLLAGWRLWHGRDHAASWLGGAGLLLIVLARLMPRQLALPSMLWWRIAHVLGWVNTRLLLSLLFLLVLTPVGCLLRLIGWDALQRRAPGTTSWQSVMPTQRGSTHYERMF